MINLMFKRMFVLFQGKKLAEESEIYEVNPAPREIDIPEAVGQLEDVYD